MSQVSIATKPLVYSTFRYIANTSWNALAEYIDNALQSYQTHKDVLSKINRGGKVRIEITINQDEITIEDNAFGIEAVNYERAFELANIPLDATGLSEFGMGMKVSSIWFSDVWSVETCAYGECVRKYVKFDIKEVVDNQETSLNVIESPAAPTEHYTKLRLTKLSQNRPKQIAIIKKHLASTYIKFIREGDLDLVINGETLVADAPNVLVAPYHKKVGGTITKEGPDKLWKVDIDFDTPKYKVKGFIGVLETMSTNQTNGFLIFRRGRSIGYSGDDKYRPYALCGQVGSPQYKRVFGELSVEGFDVSFQKNAFQEDEAFTEFIEDLADSLKGKIRRGELMDIFGQAANYTKDKTPSEVKKTAKSVAHTLANELSHPITITTDPSILDRPVQENPELVIETPSKEIQEAAKFETETKIELNHVVHNLRIQTIATGQKTGLYLMNRDSNDIITAQINMSNSFFDNFDGDEDELKRIVYFIKILITTELSMMSTAGASFRNQFNNFFGSSL